MLKTCQFCNIACTNQEVNIIKIKFVGVPVVAQWAKKLTSVYEDAGSTPGPVRGLRIRHCCKLHHGLQMQLKSSVAVAVV